MIRLLLFFCLLIGTFSLSAQAYNTAFGLRIGSDMGLSVKQRIANKTTLEGILNSGFKKDEVVVTGLVEQHFPILFKRFNVYTGAGIHKGWKTGNSNDSTETYENPFGVTLIAGGELTFGKFNVSYDYKPRLNVSGGAKAFESESSISLRYVLVKRPTKFDKWKKKRKKKKKQKQKEKAKRKKTGVKGGFFYLFKRR